MGTFRASHTPHHEGLLLTLITTTQYVAARAKFRGSTGLPVIREGRIHIIAALLGGGGRRGEPFPFTAGRGRVLLLLSSLPSPATEDLIDGDAVVRCARGKYGRTEDDGIRGGNSTPRSIGAVVATSGGISVALVLDLWGALGTGGRGWCTAYLVASNQLP